MNVLEDGRNRCKGCQTCPTQPSSGPVSIGAQQSTCQASSCLTGEYVSRRSDPVGNLPAPAPSLSRLQQCLGPAPISELHAGQRKRACTLSRCTWRPRRRRGVHLRPSARRQQRLESAPWRRRGRHDHGSGRCVAWEPCNTARARGPTRRSSRRQHRNHRRDTLCFGRRSRRDRPMSVAVSRRRARTDRPTTNDAAAAGKVLGVRNARRSNAAQQRYVALLKKRPKMMTVPSPRVAQIWSTSGQTRSTSAPIRPIPSQTWSSPGEFGSILHSGQIWPIPGPCLSVSGQVWSNKLGLIWRTHAADSTNIGQCGPRLPVKDPPPPRRPLLRRPL